MTQNKIGVILLNLGTPKSLKHSDIRSYLREFLSDHRVLDIPFVLRKILVECVIVPFRTPSSAANYKKVWLPEGSPLRVYTQQVANQLQANLSHQYVVKIAMRYGEPSISQALAEFETQQIQKIVAIPIFPQYSGAAWGSAAAELLHRAAQRNNVAALHVVPPFHAEPDFIDAWANNISPQLARHPKSHVLFTYHGLPVRQIHAADPLNQCRLDQSCCARTKATPPFCYRAQCFVTSRSIADKLGLAGDQWSLAFQSRFGNSKWLGPATDTEIERIAKSQTPGLIVASPSFSVDCLETIEEIGIRARKSYEQLGGRNFSLVPCLQDSNEFNNCLTKLVHAHS